MQAAAVEQREDGGVTDPDRRVRGVGAGSEDSTELIPKHGPTTELAGTFDGWKVERALHGLSIDEPKAPGFLQDGSERREVPVGSRGRVELLEAVSERADVLGAQLVPGQAVGGDLAAAEDVSDRLGQVGSTRRQLLGMTNDAFQGGLLGARRRLGGTRHGRTATATTAPLESILLKTHISISNKLT